MSDKIPLHNHCRHCGKAFIGEGRFCTEECMASDRMTVGKRKRQLTFFYIATMAVFAIALLMTLT
jgi:predicted nucleic acid-binding Zn ribbon protein